ncbi:MAG TPA: metal-dependent transcriptional regulator, partial [Bacillota bacterium]|nr:metal-dependent transcriptional regulator [Bacillota bacterium]
TIYILEKDHGHAHVVDIAERLGITNPSVTKAMNKLKKEGLINKESYGHITLTKKGRATAEKIYHKHCIVAKFLEKTLDLSSKEASINACRMEHIITDKMLEAIEDYFQKPKE